MRCVCFRKEDFLKKQTQATTYNVGVYCRLSREDGNGESLSIGPQKLMLTEYVTSRNWRIVDCYCDDGVSGVGFDRPELNRMKDDIEAGKINLVICKDLSRLGRNYIEAGHLCEIYFPNYGVRCLAINDDYDTDNTNNDIAPFKHLLNDMYARDISRKIRSVRKAKAAAGQYVATYAPYGYMKADDNHNMLVINEETAPVVRRIYDLYVQGLGVGQIRNILTQDKVLTPTAYANSINPNWYTCIFDGGNEEKRYNWHRSSVSQLLGNPVYAGHLVTGTQSRPSYKSQKRLKKKAADATITENAFEPIIDENTFEIVCKLKETKRREMKEQSGLELVNEFAGVIKCADCGCAMVAKTQKIQRKKGLVFSRNYVCGRYLRNHVHQCTLHHIRYDAVYQLVLRSIQKYAALSKEDRAEMAKQLAEAGNHQQSFQTAQCKKELKAAEKRLAELDRLVAKLYEEYISERVSGENYAMLMNKYQAEQTDLRRKAETLTAVLAKNEDDAKGIGEFIALIERYADVETLTPEIVSQLIDKVAVHEGLTIDGVRTQRVDIHWRFVGNLEM